MLKKKIKKDKKRVDKKDAKKKMVQMIAFLLEIDTNI
jgi:hypothetical protein